MGVKIDELPQTPADLERQVEAEKVEFEQLSERLELQFLSAAGSDVKVRDFLGKLKIFVDSLPNS